jgi:uncharacterized protein (TIGR02266 family)
MAYSGAATARSARENLGRALASLQEDSNIPPDVLAVAQNIAQAVGALFEAERASSEPDGKSSVKSALGFVSQTLALLQEVKGQHRGVQGATEAIATTLSMLFPLSTQPSRMPPPMQGGAGAMNIPSAPAAPRIVGQPLGNDGPTLRDQPVPLTQPRTSQPHAQQAGYQAGHAQQQVPQHAPAQQRGPVTKELEVNIGATTESNFYVGFSGEISEGGVFAATYDIQPRGTRVRALVTLPGGFEKHVIGSVRFVRDPMDLNAESEPGMGIQFDSLDPEARELILRFIRKRPPMFYDD